jgi:hypothetical protein
MEYFDFIKPGDLDELPEDSQLAFARFVEIAQARLAARLQKLDSNERNDWDLIQDARYGFQNLVMGAARKFGIEPFASREISGIGDYNENEYRQFRHDLTSYIAQIMLHTADADRASSVPLLDKTKQSLQTYIFHLRRAIDNTDLSADKKKALHEKLDALEKELERKRVRFVVVASIIMTILSAPGELTSSYDAVLRITNHILRELGQAKAADDEQRHISSGAPFALVAPRKSAPSQLLRTRWTTKSLSEAT